MHKIIETYIYIDIYIYIRKKINKTLKIKNKKKHTKKTEKTTTDKSPSLKQNEAQSVCAKSTNKGVNYRSKDVTQTQ